MSSTPELTPDRLRQVHTVNAPDPILSEVPDGIPDVARRLAAEVTSGATTEYDAAIALQNWFRSAFDDDLDVAAGHGVDAIEAFLETRRGYCEQFAATYAVMARTIGIPSRVAVGFTPGTLDADGWYVVTGANAHAWPELWFDGIGWVAFEPTPGRAAPGAEGYTGVEAHGPRP